MQLNPNPLILATCALQNAKQENQVELRRGRTHLQID